MADKPQQDKPQSDRQVSEPARDARPLARAATQAGADTSRASAQAADDTIRNGGHPATQAGRISGEALAGGGNLAAQTTRRNADIGEDAVHRISDASGETVRRGGQAVANGQRQIVEEAAKRFEDVGRKTAELVQTTSEDLRLLLTTTWGGLQDLQQTTAGLVEGVTRTNVQAMQELFRLANPASFVELQQRLTRNHLATLMEGTANLTRAAHRATNETLRSLEQQLEQRQQRLRAQANEGGHQGEWQQRAPRRGHDENRVADVMERQVRVTSPDDTVQQAARLMREEETGILPVGENDRLVGMVTDRDIGVRLVAEGRDPARTKVREVMTPEVRYVYEDERVSHVAENMAEQQVSRLPVVNREKRLVGVVSVGDLVAAE